MAVATSSTIDNRQWMCHNRQACMPSHDYTCQMLSTLQNRQNIGTASSTFTCTQVMHLQNSECTTGSEAIHNKQERNACKVCSITTSHRCLAKSGRPSIRLSKQHSVTLSIMIHPLPLKQNCCCSFDIQKMSCLLVHNCMELGDFPNRTC